MRVVQRQSETRKIRNDLFGWDKITVKFTHAYDESVLLGVEFYNAGEDYQVAMKDFTLTDEEGVNLITKNLNSSSGWEDNDNASFTK